MKQFFFICLLLGSIRSFSQDLECCKTIDDVKKVLTGEWVVKNGSPDIYYNIWFGEHTGGMDEYETFIQEDKEVMIISSCQPAIEVLKSTKGYNIQVTSMLNVEILAVEDLKKDSFILRNSEFKTRYIRKVN